MKHLEVIKRKAPFILSHLGALTFVTAAPALADITFEIKRPQNAIDPSVSIGQVISFIVGAAVVFGIIMALLFILIGAFQWITSGGDKGKVEGARNHIVAAIIGLIVIVLSLVILNFVLQLLGIGDLMGGLKIQSLSNQGNP